MHTIEESAFDTIDQHVKELSDRLVLSDDQLHQLFVMLSEHYGQLADKYNTAPDVEDDTDPYAEQPYCSHCGTDRRNTPDKSVTNLLPNPTQEFIGILNDRMFIRLGGTSHFLDKHSFLQIAANICDKFFGKPV